MANLGRNFDATQVDPTSTFDPIPPGKYPMVFTDSEMKPTSAGTGSYLQLTAEVIDGPSKGRLIWVRLNLDNPNPKTVEIAERELSQICHAVNKLHVQDSVELHDIPFLADVKVRPPKGNYDASNEIKEYQPLSGQPQQQAAPVAANDAVADPAPQVAAANSATSSDWWNQGK
jgi:hypothetical protein